MGAWRGKWGEVECSCFHPVMKRILAINWAMLGLEAASVECERPFGYSPNHLPLASYCIVVGENVVQTLDEVKQFGAANDVAINLK